MDYEKIWNSIPGWLKTIIFSTIGYAGGKYMDDVNAKNMISPKEAVEQAGERRNEYKGMLSDVQSGQTVNPALQQQRTATQTSLNRPVTPPATFNPYATNPNQGQVNPMLMAQMMQMAMGQNKTNMQGSDILKQSLANRFGSRDMQGKLTPATLL